MVSAKQDAFFTLATRHGYSCFLAFSSDAVDQSGRAICPGGVALLVRVCHRTTLIHKKVCASGYHVVAEVGNILVGIVLHLLPVRIH